MRAQLAVGAPFLAANWRGYLGRAFELSRVFTYKWTVNWKFLDEEVRASWGRSSGAVRPRGS